MDGKFRAALGNDLNTSLAVTSVYDVLKAKTNDKTKLALLNAFDRVLGLSLTEKAAEKRKENAKSATVGGFLIQGEDDPDVNQLILARQAAKKAKDFAEADRIRGELKDKGIELTDIPGGVQWRRV